ncbi:MAG: phage tail tape measure protein, partial [Clostridia bacterium]|nr:phage tail tape measure protein [Clostridia bacterium]
MKKLAYDGSIKIDTKVDTGGFSSGVEKMKSIASKGVSAMTTAFAAVTAGIAAGGTAAATVGSSFEAAMSKVSAISGSTGKDLQSLTDKAKEMGAKTKFSASESAEALQYMAMAGWDTKSMLSGIDGIMSLAAADGLDLATTSDIVTDALTAFGLKASDSTHFADVLAKASSSANTNVSMLGESFKYVAPLAGTMGYSVEDVSVALGLMANASVKGSMAGTSLKTALSNLASPTQQMAEVMDKYKISISDTNGNALPLIDVLKQLREKFGTLSETEQTAAASTLFGKEAMSGMLAIINASDSDFKKLTENINNADGAAQSMADTMQDNLQGQITILKSALEG